MSAQTQPQLAPILPRSVVLVPSTVTLPTLSFPPTGSCRRDRDPHCPGGGQQPLVVARQLDDLSLPSQELDRREVEGVERSHRDGKGLERPPQDLGPELEEGDALDEGVRGIAVGAPGTGPPCQK